MAVHQVFAKTDARGSQLVHCRSNEDEQIIAITQINRRRSPVLKEVPIRVIGLQQEVENGIKQYWIYGVFRTRHQKQNSSINRTLLPSPHICIQRLKKFSIKTFHYSYFMVKMFKHSICLLYGTSCLIYTLLKSIYLITLIYRPFDYTVVLIAISVFWEQTLYRLVCKYQRYEETVVSIFGAFDEDPEDEGNSSEMLVLIYHSTYQLCFVV